MNKLLASILTIFPDPQRNSTHWRKIVTKATVNSMEARSMSVTQNWVLQRQSMMFKVHLASLKNCENYLYTTIMLTMTKKGTQSTKCGHAQLSHGRLIATPQNRETLS